MANIKDTFRGYFSYCGGDEIVKDKCETCMRYINNYRPIKEEIFWHITPEIRILFSDGNMVTCMDYLMITPFCDH